MAESNAELAYGTVLKLPGEFFSDSTPNANALELLQSLRHHVLALKPVSASRHFSYPGFIRKDLLRSPCFFLRLDRVESHWNHPTLVHTR
ncbi:hypothetical protein NPIL_207931 [Nephila pilipes]|uniref:Uncharacterized protein n=1 Tax=Nephila pilipes TaxID=299642 RepID=A0A8X6TAN8_NEPPI|nr:hypothetical protein NPIL_207931 [Nephila pilipes]